jgi:hypothetical protein
MDLAWGISPKFEGLSDCVCFWHFADKRRDNEQSAAIAALNKNARWPSFITCLRYLRGSIGKSKIVSG